MEVLDIQDGSNFYHSVCAMPETENGGCEVTSHEGVSCAEKVLQRLLHPISHSTASLLGPSRHALISYLYLQD